MSSGFYIDKQSFMHRLHPVTRITLLIMSFVSALILVHPIWLMILVFIYAIAGLSTGVLANLKRVIWLLILIAFASFMIWSLAYGGQTTALRLGPLQVTYEGMTYGAGMGVRLDLMIFCGLIFLACTPIEEFTYGLTRMGLPFPVSFALSLSFRLVPIFSDTIRTILDAQRARGLDTEAGGLIGRFKSYIPLLTPVFASALRRTDQLAIALESKGFGLAGKRGSFSEYNAGTRDVSAILFMALILVLEMTARYLGFGLVN